MFSFFRKELILDKEGYIIFRENYFDITKEILNQFEKDFINKDYRDNEYQDIAIIKPNMVKKVEFYNNILNKILANKCINKKILFENVWLQNSSIVNFKKNELPFIPHIDKIRKFKVMIYLNDIGIDNGPIHLIKCRPYKYEKFRKNLPHNYREKKMNKIEDFKFENYDACHGPFGTTIIFDTNCPHYAGKPSKNKFRKILRFNFLIKDKFINFF